MNTKRWYKLDNAAIIIPPSTRGSSTRVFRIACQLKEEVDPTLLQQASFDILSEFPHFQVVLRRGLFWYYLDSTSQTPIVHIDDRPACGPLYFQGKRNLLFDISYYKKRINLEMFHVLADGTGGFQFFERLIIRYLELSHSLHVERETISSSVDEKVDDAFQKFYTKDTSGNQLKEATFHKAYQLKGEHDAFMENHMVEIHMSAKAFVDVAKQYKTTAGVLATALYIQAILQEMRIKDYKRPIVVSVPVNLRNYFPSVTTRNFYGTINISYQVTESNQDLETIIESVNDQFKTLLQEEKLRQNMNTYSSLEHNFALKLVPLFIKDIAVANIGTRSALGVTGTISNMGRISLPSEIENYVDYFSAFMAKQNMQITLVSYQDHLVFGICSDHVEHSIAYQLCKELTKFGIDVSVATNDREV